MSNTTYKKDLHDIALAVANGSKNYTDKELKKVYYDIGHNDISTSDYEGLAYQVTAPSGAKLMQLLSVGGNTVKLNPTTASDSTKALIKTMPATVYTFDVSKVEGKSEKCNNIYDSSKKIYQDTSYANGDFTTNANYDIYGYFDAKPSTTYTLSFYNNYDSVSTTRTILYYNGTTLLDVVNYTPSALSNGTYSFTTPSSTNKILVQVRKTDQKVMLNEGSTALPYEPYYSGIHNFELTGVKVEGENLLNIPDVVETTTGGITYKAVDGKIYAKRTSANENNVTINFAVNLNLTGSLNIFSTYNNNTLYYRTAESSYWSSATSTKTNITIDRFALVFGSEFNQTSYIEMTPMFVYGSTAPTTYQKYVAPTTKTIDLTTIVDGNNNKLFPNNKLMGYNDVKDVVGVYNQESKWDEYTFSNDSEIEKVTNASSPNGFYFLVSNVSGSGTKGSTQPTIPNLLMAGFTTITNNVSLFSDMTISKSGQNDKITISINSSVNTVELAKAYLNGMKLQFERATYLTSNTDLSSTLRNITGYPNGSITALNTYNMDVESVITYNSIIQETLCPSVTVDGANMFDKSAATSGKYINSSGEVGNSQYTYASDYIEVKPNTAYIISGNQSGTSNNNYYAFYDSSKNVISATQQASAPPYTFTTPSDAQYVRFTVQNALIDTAQMNLGSVAKTYKPYKASITRNLPTQTSDGYSAGTSRNTRVFSDVEGNKVSKRNTNVDTYNLGLGTYTYDTTATTPNFKTSRLSTMIANSSNIVSKSYTQENQFWNTADNWYKMSFGQNNINISNPLYTDGATFKTANDEELLYFELADASKTETSIDDIDYYFDVEEGDVITFNNPYAQQAYVNYSFLIKEEKA